MTERGNEAIKLELPSSGKEKLWLWTIVIILSLSVIGIHIYFGWLLVDRLGLPNDWQAVSGFGGFFQMVGSLFSGLAFVALIATLTIQMRDLRTQRMLVKETIAALKESAIAQKEQSETSQLMTKLSILTSLSQSYQEDIKSLKEQEYQYKSVEKKLVEITKEIEYIHRKIANSSSSQSTEIIE